MNHSLQVRFQKSTTLLITCLLAAAVGGASAQGQRSPVSKASSSIEATPRFSLSASQLLGVADSYNQAAIVSPLQDFDPRNLEAFIRYEPSSETHPYNGFYNFDASKGGIYLDLDAAAPDAWHDEVHAVVNRPAQGLALFTFDMPPITTYFHPADPVCEGCWIGLGGHRLVTAGGSFPVIFRVRGGAVPFHGALRVSRKDASWTIPVDLQPNAEGRFELKASASDNPEADFYTLTLDLLKNGDRANLLTREFRMITDRNSVYWITPQVDGASTRDHLMAVVNTHPTGSTPAGDAMMNPRRLEPVSPDVLPMDVRGWSPARTVVIGPGGEKGMSPEAKAALLAWVAAGGHLGVLQGSSLPAQVQAGTGSTKTSIKAGQGEIDIAPAGDEDGTSPSRNFIFADGHIKYPKDNPAIAAFAAWAFKLNAAPNLGNPDDALYRLAVAQEPVLHVPGWPTFAAIGLCYVAIFGPFSLWLMRRVRRILLVWLVVPALASTMGLVVLVAGTSVHHALRTLNVSTVQILPSGSSIGQSRSDMLFFTPEPGDYTISTGQLTLRGSDGLISSGQIADTLQGADHNLMLAGMPSYSEEHVHLGGVVKLDGSLTITRKADGGIVVQNHTSRELPVSVLTADKFYCTIDPLAARATKELSKPGSDHWYPVSRPLQPWSFGTTGAGNLPLQPSDFANGSGSEIRWVIPISPFKEDVPDRTTGTRDCVLVVTEGFSVSPGGNAAANTVTTTRFAPPGYPSAPGYPSGAGYPSGSPYGYPSGSPYGYPAGYPSGPGYPAAYPHS